MNATLARRRHVSVPSKPEAEMRRMIALNLSIAGRKAKREKRHAIDAALSELANDLGFAVARRIGGAG